MSSGFIGRFLPPGGVNFAPFADDQLFATQVRDVVFRHVIAQRPHQLRHRHLGARRHAAVARRIELHEPHLAGRVLDREARA